ncbi:hypothetical protein [Nonomuraea diastatica]|nr:hypothetical protein [Nonomuraea diastatica]
MNLILLIGLRMMNARLSETPQDEAVAADGQGVAADERPASTTDWDL